MKRICVKCNAWKMKRKNKRVQLARARSRASKENYANYISAFRNNPDYIYVRKLFKGKWSDEMMIEWAIEEEDWFFENDDCSMKETKIEYKGWDCKKYKF